MCFIPTIIPDVILIEPKVFADERGFVLESYQKQRFTAAGIPFDFVQDNHSRSQQGVLRGLHYQIQQAQGKLVRVIAGEVFDVAVDIRKSSPTFGKWVGEFLSADNKKMLWVHAPSVADNAALIRAMLAGEVPVPAPIRAQVAALASVSA